MGKLKCPWCSHEEADIKVLAEHMATEHEEELNEEEDIFDMGCGCS